MDNLKSLRQKAKDYKAFKNEKKFYEEQDDLFYNDREKEIEKKQFENFKERTYGVEVKGGGFIAKGCGKVMGDRRKVTKMY
jgi:hypothetical protein